MTLTIIVHNKDNGILTLVTLLLMKCFLVITNCKADGCIDNHCKFKEWDAPNVYVGGFMSKDVFTFPTEVGGNFTYLNQVVFGCADTAVGFPFEVLDNSYDINGVFGLGHGPRSFTSQFAPQQRFGYCLADWQFGPPSYPGQLLLGDDALLPISGHVKTTPIVETDNRSYFLKLVGMQINNETTMTFKEGIFDRKHDGNGSHGGFLIDSATAISYFSPDVYYVVRQEFVDYMKTLNLKEIIPPQEVANLGLDLCWDFSNDAISELPSMTLNFQDHEHPNEIANLTIGPLGVFFIEKDVENPHICLGIAHNNGADPDLNILGGKQQTGNRFSFDVQNNTLSWMFNACELPPDEA